MPWSKRFFLVVLFGAAFVILDGSSTTSKHWEGAPTWYLPVGLSLALLLAAGSWSIPLILSCSIVAAVVNYHCPLLSWCGIPGAVGVYAGYAGAAVVLRSWWRADLRQATLPDVGRYFLGCLGGSIVSTIVGVLALLGDDRIVAAELPKTAAEWWVSDALALVLFTPFLLIYLSPVVGSWLCPSEIARPTLIPLRKHTAAQILELTAQVGLVALVIGILFGYAPLAPYQPLYLLFIPVIWAAVRRGLEGAVLTTFSSGIGMTIAAWMTQAPRGSLPRLQLALLALGVTGLCLGAVVAERCRDEQSIRASETRYRLLFERNLAGVFRTHITGDFIECNPSAAQLFGYDSPEELLKVPAPSLYENAADRDAFLAKLQLEKFITNQEMRFRRKNGEMVWVMMTVSLVENESEDGPIVEGTLINISARKRAEEQVRMLAYYDALTGLPNRTLMLDRFGQALAAARRHKGRVALLFLDLDRFKTINDSLGHSVGDLLLKQVSERLKAHTREQDTVARLGGDEFLILLSDVKDFQGVAIAAERFMDTLTMPFSIQRHSLSIGCSMGISIFPDHGLDAETLIKHADSAMYSAKDSGRHAFRFFTSDMNAQVSERLQLENALRGALDDNELFLVYQPQMEIATGEIIGMEALLRWRHPELGLVPPDRFIRIAETSGLILRIGEWVLKTACEQARQWQDQGLRVTIAINVSAVQFRHERFCERVRMTLSESGLAPQFLELELTESVLLSDVEHTLSILEELKRLGLTLAIDDFGTGYSSLSYLKRFPVTRLKIDRSFIRDLGVNAEDAAITSAIISMARSLNLSVIAEGVENEQQMSFLREHRCPAIQGYYFSRPLTADEITCKFVSNMHEGGSNQSSDAQTGESVPVQTDAAHA